MNKKNKTALINPSDCMTIVMFYLNSASRYFPCLTARVTVWMAACCFMLPAGVVLAAGAHTGDHSLSDRKSSTVEEAAAAHMTLSQVSAPVMDVSRAAETLPLFADSVSSSDNIDRTEMDEMERIRSLFESGKGLYARMVHEFEDAYTGEVQITRGRIWISKDQYKIEAYPQTVLVDGTTSKVYSAVQNQLLISNYEPEEDDFAPSRFFSGSKQLFSEKEILRENGFVEILLVPDDPLEIFQQVRIRMKRDGKPEWITALDQMDNRFHTRFYEVRYLDNPSSYLFLEYPDHAEVIDLRK